MKRCLHCEDHMHEDKEHACEECFESLRSQLATVTRQLDAWQTQYVDSQSALGAMTASRDKSEGERGLALIALDDCKRESERLAEQLHDALAELAAAKGEG